MLRSKHLRKAAVTIGVVATLIAGVAVDPAYAVAVPLPVAGLEAGLVELGPGGNDAFINNCDPLGGPLTTSGLSVVEALENDGPVSDALDCGVHFTVNGVAFTDADGNVDITPNTVATNDDETVTAQNKIGKLLVTARYTISGTGPVDPVQESLQTIYSLRNKSTTKTVKVTALYSNNFGSDSSTIVEDSTDGDDALEADDTWVLTSDDGSVDDDATSDVVNRTAIGTRHSITSYPTFTTGSLQARFTFKVKPGKTVKLLFIQQFENSIAAAAGDDADFQNLTTLIAAGFPLSGSFHNWVP